MQLRWDQLEEAEKARRLEKARRTRAENAEKRRQSREPSAYLCPNELLDLLELKLETRQLKKLVEDSGASWLQFGRRYWRFPVAQLDVLKRFLQQRDEPMVVMANLEEQPRRLEIKEAQCRICGEVHGKSCRLVDIYVVSDGEAIKVGLAQVGHVERRVKSLQTASSRELALVGGLSCVDREVEKDIHRALSASHLRGEWFKPSENAWSVLKSFGVLRYSEHESCDLCGCIDMDDGYCEGCGAQFCDDCGFLCEEGTLCEGCEKARPHCPCGWILEHGDSVCEECGAPQGAP